MDMIAEEFSFPIITSSKAGNLALLPPLWRISSINHSDDAGQNGRKRKINFTVGEIVKSESDEKAEAEAQEKMDVLWEDFNEELHSAIHSSDDSDFSQEETNHYQHHNCSREEFETLEECRNVRELKLVPAKRKKLELVVKMMKKLFLLHNTTAAIKKKGPN